MHWRALGLPEEAVLLSPGRKHGLLSIPLEDPEEVVPAAGATLEWLFLDDAAPASGG